MGQKVNAVGEKKAKEEGPGRCVSKRPEPQHGNTCGYCTVGVTVDMIVPSGPRVWKSRVLFHP
jgi:hypothetical protein